jgi:hypothetical protein
VPQPPTAYPVFCDVKERHIKMLPCGRGFCHSHCWDLTPLINRRETRKKAKDLIYIDLKKYFTG